MIGQTDKGKMEALTALLETGIKAIFESQRYKEYLGVVAKFHRYSARNTLLILLQKPDASYVAGFGAWKSMERSVNKGEKGIQILAPAPYKKTVEVTRGEDGELLQKPQRKAVTITAFRPAYVFDVSQTQGRELPRLVTQLMGTVAAHDELMWALCQASPCVVTFEPMEGSKNGYYNFTDQRIALREGNSQEQTIKTLVHEIAHARLGHGSNPNTDRHTCEVQAESVAYIVCQHLGIDSAQYSFGYIAQWSKDKELPQLHASLEVIQKTAGEIIGRVDEVLLELQRGKEQSIGQKPVAPEAAPKEDGYKMFYSGAGGQDKEAHAFQKETGWQMAWGSDGNGLNGDTWIVYRHIEDLPKQLQKIVPQLEHKKFAEEQPAVEKAEAVKEAKQQVKGKKLPISERLDAAKKECATRDAARAPQEHTQKKQSKER